MKGVARLMSKLGIGIAVCCFVLLHVSFSLYCVRIQFFSAGDVVLKLKRLLNWICAEYQ